LREDVKRPYGLSGGGQRLKDMPQKQFFLMHFYNYSSALKHNSFEGE
jgi:hypothetical protein